MLRSDMEGEEAVMQEIKDKEAFERFMLNAIEAAKREKVIRYGRYVLRRLNLIIFILILQSGILPGYFVGIFLYDLNMYGDAADKTVLFYAIAMVVIAVPLTNACREYTNWLKQRYEHVKKENGYG